MQHVDILAVGAHPDDVELSCGGTLIRHIRRGYTVGLLDLTRGELGTRGSADLRDREAADAAAHLHASFRVNLDLGDGTFANSPGNRRRIIEIVRACTPRLVLANALADRHPDHGRAAALTAEACFYAGLRKIATEYDGRLQEAHRPAQVIHYIQDYFREPDFVVDVTDAMEAKIDGVRAFKSQFHDPDSDEPETPLSGEEFFPFLYARAREFGRPAGYTFAEGFEHSRRFGVRDLLALD